MCHEIFYLQFFHDSNQSGPLINKLRYFRIQLRFPRDIRSQSCLRGVQHTAEIKKRILKQIKILSSNLFFHNRCLAPIKWFLLIVSLIKSNHRQVKILIPQCAIYLCGMLHTAEIDSTVFCTPLRSSMWCDCAQRLSR